jgi:hypothetical protein
VQKRGAPARYGAPRMSQQFATRIRCLMSNMSESAAIIKLFFVPRLLKTIAADTLQATGAEDKRAPG